ncbi:MAG TPA: hypothetical protein VK524_10170 [Polyangiaceae bacterium]|nr:hypothetical protein [Polyangiaceae bacterium]
MTLLRGKALLLSAGLILAGVFCNTQAHAYNRQTYDYDRRTFGNFNFYADYSYLSEEGAWGGGPGCPAPTAWYGSDAEQKLTARAQVFGNMQVPLDVHSLAGNSNGMQTNTYGKVAMMGNMLFENWGAMGCYGDAKTRCVAFEKSLSTTLFQAQYTFTLGPVPVTVKAKITGTLHAGVSALSHSNKYIGKLDSLYGKTAANMDAGGYVTTRMDAYAGIEDVLGVGVTLTFKLIDVGAASASGQTHVAPHLGSTARVIYTNRMPLHIGTMSGRAKVWADLIFASYSKELVSWSGYTREELLNDESGTIDVPICSQ